MRKLMIMAMVVMGMGLNNVTASAGNVPAKAEKNVKATVRHSLPETIEIDVEDVPTIVLNGLNNTYVYDEILKIEVCTYNNMDIYKFTLLTEKGDTIVAQFTSTGVEI